MLFSFIIVRGRCNDWSSMSIMMNKYRIPVVGDLGDGVGVGDRVLQVRHEHEVPRVVPVVVDGVVIDVAQDGLQGVGR